jgi:hypothetical protein
VQRCDDQFERRSRVEVGGDLTAFLGAFDHRAGEVEPRLLELGASGGQGVVITGDGHCPGERPPQRGVKVGGDRGRENDQVSPQGPGVGDGELGLG